MIKLQIHQISELGDYVAFDMTIYLTPVPESATMAALGIGAAATLRCRKR